MRWLTHRMLWMLMLVAMVPLLTSCGASKDGVAKPSKFAKAYQSFISLFNGYYHAEVRYREATSTITMAYEVPVEEDKFLSVLDLPAGDKAAASVGLLDQAIEKCDLIIFRRKQSSYQDDCHFLKAKCWFYKKNTSQAMSNLNYVLYTFPKSKLVPEVLYWKALINLSTSNEFGAKEIAAQLQKTEIKNKRVRADVGLLVATILVNDGKYTEAILSLEQALETLKGRDRIARVHFLLAQLYDRGNNFGKSYENYLACIKYTLNNELLFKAKLNSAKLFIKYQPKDADPTIVGTTLRKLLKDGKYADYRDQVLYQYAQLEVKSKNYDQAITYLKQALKANAGNEIQKVLCYYLTGELYFYQKTDYVAAQAYFDSAATIVPKDFPKYAEIKAISKTLNEFVTAKRTITLQDSLQRLASFTDAQLDQYVSSIIQREEDLKRQEIARRQAENQSQQNALLNQVQTTDVVNQQQGAAFYFDNPMLVSNGRLEFNRIWGTRKREDNWRRRNKEAVFAANETDANGEAVDTARLSNNLAVRKAAYKKDVPRTADDIAASNEKIATAILQLASIFANRLNQPDSAIVYYKMYLRRFPQGSEVARAWYALNNLYALKQNRSEADKYKQLILSKFSGSMYARLLRRESVLDESEENKQDFNSGYAALLDLYGKGDYATALNFSSFLLVRFDAHPEVPRIIYLKGLCYGYLGNKDSLRSIFKSIVKNFNGTEVATVAAQTLAKMDAPPVPVRTDVYDPNDPNQQFRPGQPNPTPSNPTPRQPAPTPNPTPRPAPTPEPSPTPPPNKPGTPGNVPAPDNGDKYKGFEAARRNNEPAIGILLVDQKKISAADLQVRLSDFHSKYFRAENLRVSILLYNNSQHLAFITQFADYKGADNYVKFLRKEPNLLELAPNPENSMFFMSSSNFRMSFSQKRFADYAAFFKENYTDMIQSEKKP
jgi:tetratricopeptide (TPR) repeat protein